MTLDNLQDALDELVGAGFAYAIILRSSNTNGIVLDNLDNWEPTDPDIPAEAEASEQFMDILLGYLDE